MGRINTTDLLSQLDSLDFPVSIAQEKSHLGKTNCDTIDVELILFDNYNSTFDSYFRSEDNDDTRETICHNLSQEIDLRSSPAKSNNTSRQSTADSLISLTSTGSTSTNATQPIDGDPKNVPERTKPIPPFKLHRQLSEKNENLSNILDCLGDMITQENDLLLLELSRLVQEVQVSIPNNTYIIPKLSLDFTTAPYSAHSPSRL